MSVTVHLHDQPGPGRPTVTCCGVTAKLGMLVVAASAVDWSRPMRDVCPACAARGLVHGLAEHHQLALASPLGADE